MRRFHRILLPSVCAMTLALDAAAQGSDDCATATQLVTTGTISVTTVGSTDGTQQPSCSPVHHDVWFLWTATATTTMDFSTCGATSADTVIAVYQGSACPLPGSEIACNDDSCGEQSRLQFNSVAGQSYLLQIGSYDPSTTFTASFHFVAYNGPCNISSGPDVVVGQIIGVMNTTALNGLDAFTVGATACNAGNAVINWIGPTNQHPVICEAFFKHRTTNGAGRFEQIGLNWLKHGFASDTTTVCCTCFPPGDNQHMGLGCSDTYSAGQAGAQASLTPRWQVNPHTGNFPYPGANPAWSGNTARRTEVLLTDLEPSSDTVHYFTEVTYITADDAQAGNGNNNASYIGMSVTNGPTNYTFGLSGATVPMQDAIRAWPTLEAGVTLTNIQIPNDGLFIVGSKATDLGGGLFHYEFAVHNVNSYLAGGSFSVPVPNGAVLTNVGFHDVTFRNGDGLNNVNQTPTDWVPVQANGSITWSCDTPATDANANAIRWQTMYNFRFDANIPPVDGNIALGVWNVLTPTTYPVAAQVPAGNGGLTYLCAGDGSLAPCPCANNGQPGRGCENSGLTGGASISGSGVPSLSADTLSFTTASELATAPSMLLQGDSSVQPLVFGDGLRCAGGHLRRMFVQIAFGGSVTMPGPGDLSVSARSAFLGDVIPLGGVRVYQVYYRDPDPTHCPVPTGNLFNATNAIAATWGF